MTHRPPSRTPAGRPVSAPSRPLVVVPTYDEVDNVGPLAERILRVAPDARVLFVDDASPDGTAERIAELGRDEPRIRLLSRPAKLGLGTAYLKGFETGLVEGFDPIVTMDADLSHDPEHLPALLEAAASTDLVIGSRYVDGGGVENWGLHRRLLSRHANRLARWTLRLPVRDVTSGFRAYRATALGQLPLASIRSSGYSFLEEITVLAHRLGFGIGEIPIVFCDREGGRSKISAAEIYRAAYHLLRLGLRGGPAPGAHPATAGLRGEYLVAGAPGSEPSEP